MLRLVGLLPAALAALAPTYTTTLPAHYSSPSIAKYTEVFGVGILFTPGAVSMCDSDTTEGSTPDRCDHVVNVVAQLLDNDSDGVVDDPAVVTHMTTNKYALIVPGSESEIDSGFSPPACISDNTCKLQMSGIWEAYRNSCDTPTNRGATTARSTWEAARNTQSGCNVGRDATTEEVLHLITEAAAAVFPTKWAANYQSTSGAAISATNGNCGWGHSNDYKNPSGNTCSGQYAYDDQTCDEACIVVEGIYWAIVSYIGGLYTSARAASTANEWLMTTPDDGMTVEPSGVANAKTLQSGSPALYALVADSTSDGHKWIPAIMPDGNYQGPALSPSSSPSPSSPGPSPSSSPPLSPSSSPSSSPSASPDSDTDSSAADRSQATTLLGFGSAAAVALALFM